MGKQGKQKEAIKDLLKLLLPETIYDYFELVHTVVSDEDVHLFLDERQAYITKGRGL